MKLGCCSITWGGVVGDPVGVTSVKDLFYRANGDALRAIAEIGEVGYRGIEMFDGNVAEFANRPEDLIDGLQAAGLDLVSVYTGANFIYADILPDELHRVRRAAEFAAMFGAGRLVVGGGARRAAGTADADYTRLGQALDSVCDIAEQHGLKASYHPHLSTIVENPNELQIIMGRSRIAFCPDTAHLAAGGGDPADLIRTYPDRISHVHLKDLRPEPFAFVPLGQGVLNFLDVVRALREAGYDSWLMVELDSYEGDPQHAARISKDYIERVLIEAGIGHH